MKLNSKFFDSIRVKPSEDRSQHSEWPLCQWRECHNEALFPAPKGRDHDGEYYHFCLKHVQHYNKSYNYFSGMSDGEVINFQEESITGHRPTWSVGRNSIGNGSSPRPNHDRPDGFLHRFSVNDPFGVSGEAIQKETAGDYNAPRPIKNMERKCLKALHLDERASAEDVKRRFKDLVKRHHPDLNDGDQGSEDRLREIIQAYNYLKQSGFC